MRVRVSETLPQSHSLSLPLTHFPTHYLYLQYTVLLLSYRFAVMALYQNCDLWISSAQQRTITHSMSEVSALIPDNSRNLSYGYYTIMIPTVSESAYVS